MSQSPDDELETFMKPTLSLHDETISQEELDEFLGPVDDDDNNL
jgi:hypothetical protein